MSAVNLLQPILDGGVQRNNFFNGRLLSAEDLRAEQDANRTQRGQLARAIGDGVAWGLDVSLTSAAGLRLTVRRGLALNRHLDLLSLTDDTEVTLMAAPATASAEGTGVFAECDPPRTSVEYTGGGAYVLVAAPASGYKGSALVSDPNTTSAGRGACGARFSVEGMRFRLVPMTLTRFADMDAVLLKRVMKLLPPEDIEARERLRNLLAHLCFGTQQLVGYFADPLAPKGKETTWQGWGAVDAMLAIGDLTDCDVPLALVVLTGAGISFVDVWSVRRTIQGAGAVATWRGAAGPRRVREAEAAFLQFQAQLEVVKSLAAPARIPATSCFDVLPPAGWLPAGRSGFNWRTFLGAHAPPETTPVDAALVRGIIERSWYDEPFALATVPPVPLRVYEVPNEPFVVFARSSSGSVRVLFSPPPTAGQPIDVQLSAKAGTASHSSTLSEDRITIPDLEPGVHTLTVTAPDYLPVSAGDVIVVGGRTVDVSVVLTPQPNGAIFVDVIDKSTDNRIAAGRVLRVTATGDGATFDAVAKEGKWLLADLPAATYTITGSAAGYESAAPITVGPTMKGAVLDAVLRLEPSVHAAPQPPRCIAIARIARPPLSKVRLCMILKATEFEERYFYRGDARRGEGAIANDKFRISSRGKAGADRGSRYVTSSGEIVYSKGFWKELIPLREIPEEVLVWLQLWRDWIADELSVASIRKATPVIFFDPNYRIPKEPMRVPALPPAYAHFGHLVVPLAIRSEAGLTKLPVRLDGTVLPWVSPETFDALRDAGMYELNDLAWAWRELVIDATGDPPDTAPYLIDDAATAVGKVNAVRGYYPGLTPEMDAALKRGGFPTDLSIANAAADKLAALLGNRGFAVRLIHEARQIVPRSSWSLEELPLTPAEVDRLYVFGIESQGVFLESSGDTAGKELIAEALGIRDKPVAGRDKLLEPLVNEAILVLTSNAVMLAPTVALSTWTGVDPTTAAKLEEHGIASVDELARADEGTVAAVANLTGSDATSLVTKAKEESLAQVNVETVLSLSPSAGTELNRAFGGARATLGGMLGKSAAELTGTFGDEARAGSVLNGLRQGFNARGIK